jgi:hypothetical protein
MIPAEVCGAAVRLGAAPPPPEPVALDARLWSGQGRLLAQRWHARLEMARVGRFAVLGGEQVIVEPADGADGRELAAVIHGTVAGLVLAQRGRFALHASTVEVGDGAIAVAGRSGAGKSTAALALHRAGHPLVTDDVSAVRWSAGTPEVVPYGRPWHVWPDTAAALGLDLTGAVRVEPAQPKLSLPALPSAPVTLRAIAVLRPDPAARAVTATRVTGVAAVHVLLANAYRVRILARLWRTDLFSWATALADRLPVWTVTRPAASGPIAASAAEVAAAIEGLAAAAVEGLAAPTPVGT